MNAATPEPVLRLDGELSFETLPAVLEKGRAYSQQSGLPDRLTIDFAEVGQVDSAAVALLLEWRREAIRRGRTLTFVNLPASLVALAELYGVADLIQPCRA